MKKLFVTMILFLGLFSTSLYAHKVGNGGDYLRGTFISMGNTIVKFLEESIEGHLLLEKNNLKTFELLETLDINRIVVTADTLKDNSGSVVDAIGIPGLITINQNSWFSHFENSRDVYYLVFHEMLRSLGVDDDNFIISKALKDFPLTYRIETKIAPNLPLIEEDQVMNLINTKGIIVNGSGCKFKENEMITELNEDKNIFQIELKNFIVNLNSAHSLDMKACSLAIPLKLAPKKRMVVSLIDLKGQLDLEKGSTAKLRFEAFIAGNSQKAIEKVMNSNNLQSKSFLMRKTDILKSSCGGSDIMRINTNLQANSLLKPDQSVAIKSISIYLNVEDCKS